MLFYTHKKRVIQSIYKLYQFQSKKKHRLRRFILRNALEKKYNIIIGTEIKLGDGMKLPHPHNIVIGQKCDIGEKCTIYHDVTIGQNKGKYPVIGKNVIIYAGAKVIGGIEIGDDVVIGANAVVTKSFESGSIVAGVPAVVVGKRTCSDGFY